MNVKNKSNSKIEKMVSDTSFSYKQPWFYNHSFALRCELGIGDSKRVYLKNAKKRAFEIFDILFQNPPDAIFFDHYVEDLSLLDEININNTIGYFKKDIRFLAQHINKYEKTVIFNIPLDEDEDSVQKNRIICYTDAKYPYKKRAIENFHGGARTVHFVSFENECILSIYDDRGCDIVFATREKMREFYDKLKPYFLEYDAEEMSKRFND
ncbi:MAG: DUF3885 domain-containing protein [Clostridia bacterium]|nr:DUF3885 domain-containing protein [Clostridia bacterium]